VLRMVMRSYNCYIGIAHSRAYADPGGPAAWTKEIQVEVGGHEDRPCGRTVPEAAEPVYGPLDRLAPEEWCRPAFGLNSAAIPLPDAKNSADGRSCR